MIVEFFRYGAGLSKGPLDYFLGKKRDREHAKILSGNEQEVAGLIDSSPFAKKYTSGCLSFYESDLSDEAKRKIMADFEHCLFPGMSSDQYRVLWIEHRDKINEETGERRLELNFLIPNTEILTGNRLQPFYHEADMPRVDLFKKIINFEHQLHDPDDPMFRQDIKTKKSLPKNTADIKRVLDVAAKKQIEEGFITDRESMKQWLIDLGLDVTKETAKAISIRNPYGDENSRPIRLEGAIYEQNFRFGAEGDSLTAEASERYRREARKRYRENLQRYAEQIDGKIREFQQKYQQRDAELEKAGHASHERAKDPNLDQQGGVEKSAERSHERDYRADYNRQEDVAESTYRSNHRNSGSLPEASRELRGDLARVHPLERRNSKAIQFKNGPYFIKYSLDFSSTYRLYQHHFDDIRRDEQVQRDPSQRSASTADRASHRGKNSGIQEVAERHLRDQKQQREEINGSRSTVIADYRATTRAIETATATLRAEMRAVEFSARSIEQNTERTRQIVEQFGESRSVYEPSQGLFDCSFQSNRRETQVTRKQSFTNEFVEQLAAKFRAAVTTAFTAISDKFKYRESIEIIDRKELTENSASRNRSADHSACTAIFERERERYQVSNGDSSFNSKYIFEALDVLDQRKQQKLREQERKYSRGMDFDM